MSRRVIKEDHPLLGREYNEIKDTHQFRLAKLNGEIYMLTMDFNPTRVNIEVENGIVVMVWFG